MFNEHAAHHGMQNRENNSSSKLILKRYDFSSSGPLLSIPLLGVLHYAVNYSITAHTFKRELNMFESAQDPPVHN